MSDDPKYFDEENMSPDQMEYLNKCREQTHTVLRTTLMRFGNIKAGDFITINFPSTINQTQMYLAAEQAQVLAKAYNCNIMILSDGITVAHVPAEDMKEFGWIPDPDFNHRRTKVN